MFGKRGNEKRGEASTYGLEHLSDWIVTIVLAVIIIGGIILYLSGGMTGAIDYLKNLLRFGK